jgi:DNA replication ATP-dependent helicase Dna2
MSQDDGELHSMPGESQELLAIAGLHEVEEDIWSPKWGLKGKVDASVQAVIVRKAADAKQKSVFAPNLSKKTESEVSLDEMVAPLEIKTGRAVGLMAHRAQTMLYTLLMEDRYGMSIKVWPDPRQTS